MSAYEPIPPELAIDGMEPFDVEMLPDVLSDLAEAQMTGDELRAAIEAQPAVAAVVRWSITDDESAEWALRRLAEYEAELAQLEERAGVWADKIRAWFVSASRRPRSSAEFFRDHLARYALARREETGGRVKTVTLPSGRIATRRGDPPKVRVGDPDAFREWALENLAHPAVRFKAELDAREAKEHLAVTDGVVVDELTGERVEWAAIEPPTPPSATVTPR